MVRSLSIGQLAASAGVQISTIRFYERSGLLPCPNRTAGGHRNYSAHDVQHVLFIRRARELGLSIGQVRSIASMPPGQPGECERVKSLAEQHLKRIQRDIADLKRKEEMLSNLLTFCADGGRIPCPILSELRGGSSSLPTAPSSNCADVMPKERRQ